MPFTPTVRPPSNRSTDQRWQSGYHPGSKPEFVIVRISRKTSKKKKEDSIHGNWKIAYADFATAMFAFFLLLWMVAVTTDEQKDGLASYFEARLTSSNTVHGAGGKMGGRSVSSKGEMLELKSSKSSINRTNRLQDQQQTLGNQPSYLLVEGNNSFKKITTPADVKPAELTKDQKKTIANSLDEEEFAKAEEELRQAIQSIPELESLKRNIVIDRTPEGFRIQMVDQEKTAMFPSGSAVFSDAGARLMKQIAIVVQKMPNHIAITGHTDGNPFKRSDGYSNWELSSDRANASRRILIESGLDPQRIASVVGKADTEYLNSDDPISPLNRRISFVLLRIHVGPHEAHPAVAPVAAPIPITVQ